MSDNVLNFPSERLASSRKSDESRKAERAQAIIQEVRSCGRLSKSDRETMASNLGLLAVKIDESKPQSAIREIFFRSGLESKFAKRKRYCRLEGEDIGPDDVIAASGADYLSLASAAGALLCHGSSDRALGASEMQAIDFLLSGTSFKPEFRPSNVGEVRATDILEEYADKVARIVAEQSQLVDLWRAADTTPLGTRDADSSLPIMGEGEYGEAVFEHDCAGLGSVASVPKITGRSRVNGSIFHIGSHPDRAWMYPSVRLGQIAIRYDLPVAKLPLHLRETFLQGLYDGSNNLEGDALEWLEEIGWLYGSSDHRAIPDAEKVGWGSASLAVVLTRDVFLEVHPDIQGKPELRVMIVSEFTDPRCIYRLDDKIWDVELQSLLLGEGGDQPISVAGDDAEVNLYYIFFDEDDHQLPVAISDVLNFDWFGRWPVDGWISDQIMGPLLSGRNCQFQGEDERFVAGANLFPENSIGAYLLECLKAPEIPKNPLSELLSQAQMIGAAGLGFLDAYGEQYRTAIRDLNLS